MNHRKLCLLGALPLGAALVATPASLPLAAAPARAADASSADAKVQAAIDRGLAFLKSQQKPDGGWQKENDPPAITAIALKAFAQDPKTGPNADFVKKGYDKLLTYQLDNGGIYQDLLANYNTSIAISALSAANNPGFKERIDKAVAYIKGIQWTAKTGAGPKGETVKDGNKNCWDGRGITRARRPQLSKCQ